jgi:hypothetical protein
MKHIVRGPHLTRDNLNSEYTLAVKQFERFGIDFLTQEQQQLTKVHCPQCNSQPVEVYGTSSVWCPACGLDGIYEEEP